MPEFLEATIQQLCERFNVDSEFLVQCLHESVIEIRETDGHWDLDSGTALRLRQLQRICRAFNVELPVALHLLNLNQRIAELEQEVRLLRGK